ncbi:alpha/beta hydrolase [Methylomonas rivi]|uniref:Alpha/beta hydrolase n=1 Tax=Methylomonas rivi TaxID=2952226 RepID=A0ABT1U3Y4_9GAMM|nr:alpha/beta hydrolase [Methylomonas sp. WSC-6]MCQ8128559.1 alpha/beta hydrolase [Methylomonas sp. WSC-6]
MRKLVIYNHGKDSIPWGEKPLGLAEVARQHGYMFISPDYQDSNDPEARVDKLLSLDVSAYRTIVLAGSSMGAYVAAVAAERLKPAGLFLIAPAFYLPGYARNDFKPGTAEIEVFHGWRDDVVPPENAWRFCQSHRASLHMLDGDHRLLSVLPQMAAAFDAFLTRCDKG